MFRAFPRSVLLPLLIASAGCAGPSAPGAGGSPAPPPESILIRRATDPAGRGAPPIYVVDGIERPTEFLRTLDPDDIVAIEITRPADEFATDTLPLRRSIVRITTRTRTLPHEPPPDA